MIQIYMPPNSQINLNFDSTIPPANLGKFKRIREMCTELIIPDLRGCELKPYISVGAKRNVRDIEVKIEA